jgi:hypothetical protein
MAAGPYSAADMTVVFDAEQNPAGNFGHLASAGLRYAGSPPAPGQGRSQDRVDPRKPSVRRGITWQLTGD